jgi:hypothetical protein
MSVDNFVAGSDEDGTATVIELIWSIGMRSAPLIGPDPGGNGGLNIYLNAWTSI